jgi:hypothetical protein
VGNSTKTLQNIVDEVATIGDLNPVLTNTGGWAKEPAVTIANDVMSEFISTRFPWKWNSIKLKPFVLFPTQQDYATVNLRKLGWLTAGLRVDINNSQVPPPSWPVIVVRDLPMDNTMAGWPGQVCWLQNDQMEQGIWPGPGVTYTEPIGATTPVINPVTNILDIYGNILILTKYGTTGLVPPAAVIDPANPDADLTGQVINDGSCQWTVADPYGQGFRIFPRTPRGGIVWLMRLWGQLKAPQIVEMQDLLNPIPDDYIKWFRDGFVAYSHRYSSTPSVKARFEPMKTDWLVALASACKEADREDEHYGFYPDQSLAATSYIQDQGPYPYRWGWI